MKKQTDQPVCACEGRSRVPGKPGKPGGDAEAERQNRLGRTTSLLRKGIRGALCGRTGGVRSLKQANADLTRGRSLESAGEGGARSRRAGLVSPPPAHRVCFRYGGA